LCTADAFDYCPATNVEVPHYNAAPSYEHPRGHSIDTGVTLAEFRHGGMSSSCQHKVVRCVIDARQSGTAGFMGA
jgi:hypothetical protein